MPRKTKPFIDKKKAAVYHLMHRPSERVTEGDTGERTYVRTDRNWGQYDEDDLEDELFGSTDGSDDDALQGQDDQNRKDLLELGFPDDGYNYNQHLRTISKGDGGGGSTVFIPTKVDELAPRLAPDKRAYDASWIEKIPEDPFEASLLEAKGAKAKVTAEPGTLANELEELEAALNSENEEDEDWVLNDDFVECALARGEGDETSKPPSMFQFAELHGALDEEGDDSGAEEEEEEERNNRRREREQDDLGARYDDTDSEDDDDLHSLPDSQVPRCSKINPGPRTEVAKPLTLMDDAFERLALNYDLDDIGDLEEDEMARGKNDLIGTFSEVLDEFIDNNKLVDPEFENGYTVIGKGVRDPKEEAKMFDDAITKTHVLGAKIEKNKELGIRDDVKILTEYDKVAIEEKWDVETIVSTYSNLDNHPGVLRVDSNKSKKPKNKASLAAIPDMETEVEETKSEDTAIKEHIKLSRRQGLPVDYLPWKGKGDPCAPDSDDDSASTMHGMDITRKKDETAEEKKLRKAAVKAERREARANKKANKDMCKEQHKKVIGASGVRQSVMPL